jgi:hypothetical protein
VKTKSKQRDCLIIFTDRKTGYACVVMASAKNEQVLCLPQWSISVQEAAMTRISGDAKVWMSARSRKFARPFPRVPARLPPR